MEENGEEAAVTRVKLLWVCDGLVEDEHVMVIGLGPAGEPEHCLPLRLAMSWSDSWQLYKAFGKKLNEGN